MENEQIKLGEKVFYVKQDGDTENYYFGCAPVIGVIPNDPTFMKEVFDLNEIDGVIVEVEEAAKGDRNYQLSLKKGEFMFHIELYVLKLNQVVGNI